MELDSNIFLVFYFIEELFLPKAEYCCGDVGSSVVWMNEESSWSKLNSLSLSLLVPVFFKRYYRLLDNLF